MKRILSLSLVSICLLSCQKDKTPRKLDLNLTYKGASVLSPVNSIISTAFDPILDVSANSVCFTPIGVVYPGMDSILFDVSGIYWGGKTGGIEDEIGFAHLKNLSVMIRPQIDFQDNITLSTTFDAGSDWTTFESSYTAFLIHWANVADSLNVEVLCIGDDFEYFTITRPDYWAGLIDSIREIYSGKLTYAADWDSYGTVPFWSDLDYIGINAYFPINPEPTPLSDDVEQNWLTDVIPDMEVLQTSVGIPVIFTEYGYRSVDYCGNEPWVTDSLGAVNTFAQENCLLGLYNAFDGKDWFEGGFVKGWDIENPNAGGASDDGFTPQNKDAGHFLKVLFGSN